MNRGAQETRKAIEDRKISVNAAAKLVGADSGTFSKILRHEGRRKPGRALAFEIFRVFGVSPTLWDDAVPDEPANPDEPTERPHTGT